MRTLKIALLLATLLMAGCWGSHFISADNDLEEIYVGKSYYDIVRDFGRPNATTQDGRGGTKMVYDSVNFAGTQAARLYTDYWMRNRTTRQTGNPSGRITFLINPNMKCYAVDSDFQRRRGNPPDDGSQRVIVPEPHRKQMAKPKFPRTIDFPYVERRNAYAEKIRIEKVELDRLQTKIYFSYQDRTPVHRPLNEHGVYIMPEVYIEDCQTHQRYALTDADGITYYPVYTQFAHNDGGYDVLVYSLTFEPVSESTRKIDIVEPGHSGCNFYGVDVVTQNYKRTGVQSR